jgi:hypothetical protein
MSSPKFLLFNILLIVNISILTANSTGEIRNDNFDPIDIGVLDIFDLKLNLNYNQAFLHFLKDNPMQIKGKISSVGLIEHSSNAKFAVGAKFERNFLIVTLYKEGKLYHRDTTPIVSLEKQKLNKFGPPFKVVKTSNGYSISESQIPVDGYIYNILGIRNGQIIKSIQGTSVETMNISQINKIIYSDYSQTLNFEFWDQIKNTNVSANFVQQSVVISQWNEILTHYDVITIFKEIYQCINKSLSKYDVICQPEVKTYLVSQKIAPRFTSVYCKSQDQIAIHESKTHPVSLFSVQTKENGLMLDSIFKHEKFYYSRKKEKKSEIGDAALYPTRYYNYDQKESRLSENNYVDNQLIHAVKDLSGPFYNKPGVFANYFVAAREYEYASNYSSALNQYYASMRKIDDVICSEKTKMNAKRITCSRISFCTMKQNQPILSSLMKLSSDCIDIALESNTLDDGDENFYKFSKDIEETCIDVENKLAEQKRKNTWNAIGSIANLAAGALSLKFDATGLTALSFYNSHTALREQNFQFNISTNQILTDITSSLNINLPKELIDDENNPYEVMASLYINEAILAADDKEKVLEKIKSFFQNDPKLKDCKEIHDAIDQTLNYFKLTGKLDHLKLIEKLSTLEIRVYRFEKRGLQVQDLIKP